MISVSCGSTQTIYNTNYCVIYLYGYNGSGQLGFGSQDYDWINDQKFSSDKDIVFSLVNIFKLNQLFW